MPPAIGALSTLALRHRGRISGGTEWTPASPPTYYSVGAHHQLPFLSENIVAGIQNEADDTISGKGGVDSISQVGRMPGGTVELQGWYNCLDQIFSMALGWEKVRSATVESPSCVVDGGGTVGGIAATTDATLNAGTVLELTTSPLVAANVGDYVRLEPTGTGCALKDSVRRITAVTDGNTGTINISWGYGIRAPTNPTGSVPCHIGRLWKHKFECSPNLHAERAIDLTTGTWASEEEGYSASLTRNGLLVIQKGGVSVLPWDAAPVMINKLTIKVSGQKMTLSVDLVVGDVVVPSLYASAAVSFSDSPHILYERVLRSDCVLWLDTFSTTVALTSADALGVSDFEITIDNGLEADVQTTATGLYRAEPMRGKKRTITGKMTLPRYSANTLLAAARAGTEMMAMFRSQSSTAILTSYYQTLWLWLKKLKLKNADAPISGPAPLNQTVEFECIELASTTQPSGFPTASSGMERSPLTIETQNFNPFNSFMDQFYLN